METAILTVATDLDAAASRPGQEHKSVSKVKQKARAFLQEMVANISPAFIRYQHFTFNESTLTPTFTVENKHCSLHLHYVSRLTGWVLLKLFNGFFWSIQIHKGQLEMVKKAASEVRNDILKTMN